MDAGVWLSPVPVPRAVPPEMALYQVIVPVAQVPAKETIDPAQILVLSTETAVGFVGCAVTVTWLVATLELLQLTFSQEA